MNYELFLKTSLILKLKILNNFIYHFKFIVQPAATSFSFNFSASSLPNPGFKIQGNFSDISLASFNPKLNNVLISLITEIFFAASTAVNSTSKEVFFYKK